MLVYRRSERNVRLEHEVMMMMGVYFIYLDEYRDLHFGEYAAIEDKLRQNLKLSNCNMTFT